MKHINFIVGILLTFSFSLLSASNPTGYTAPSTDSGYYPGRKMKIIKNLPKSNDVKNGERTWRMDYTDSSNNIAIQGATESPTPTHTHTPTPTHTHTRTPTPAPKVKKRWTTKSCKCGHFNKGRSLKEGTYVTGRVTKNSVTVTRRGYRNKVVTGGLTNPTLGLKDPSPRPAWKGWKGKIVYPDRMTITWIATYYPKEGGGTMHYSFVLKK